MFLSLVIPVYNEEAAIPLLLPALARVLERMDCGYEIVFVNDGSTDGTARLLRAAAAADPAVKVLEFSRNFGHQAAITAGLDFAAGDAVVVMDADLQDPPELLPQMVELYRRGYDVVSPQRVARAGDGAFKRTTAALFYRLMRRTVDRRLVSEVGDFRLFSRAAVTALRRFREQHRFMRGLVAWLGLKEALVPFQRQPRAAGETKYPLSKMLGFAWTAITSFSALPLRLVLGGGLLLTVTGLAVTCYVLFALLRGWPAAWETIIGLQLLLSGVTLLAVGLVGDYVGRIYAEAKGRPLYVVAEALNLLPGGVPARALVLPARPEADEERSAEWAEPDDSGRAPETARGSPPLKG
jgi:glycosyltransferase involved in cell wall biosynthesis